MQFYETINHGVIREFICFHQSITQSCIYLNLPGGRVVNTCTWYSGKWLAAVIGSHQSLASSRSWVRIPPWPPNIENFCVPRLSRGECWNTREPVLCVIKML